MYNLFTDFARILNKMDFVIRKRGNFCLLDIKKDIFDTNLLTEIFGFIKKNIKNKNNLALNLKQVKAFDCAKTLNLLFKENITIAEAKAELIVQANLLGQKLPLKIFFSEEDFMENKRSYTRRRFTLIK